MIRPLALDHDLVRRAREHLSALLGPGWSVEQAVDHSDENDVRWRIAHHAQAGHPAVVLVEVKTHLTPAQAKSIVGTPFGRTVPGMEGATVVVIAPWLSHRTREVLAAGGVGYIDLTGNVSIRFDDPLVVIRTDGAVRNPLPSAEPRRGLTGANAGRLVRELVDFHPPRRSRELAAASGISEGCVSRLLDLMDREALIHREGKVVSSIDWRALLVARGSAQNLLKINTVVPMIARQGRSGSSKKSPPGIHPIAW